MTDLIEKMAEAFISERVPGINSSMQAVARVMLDDMREYAHQKIESVHDNLWVRFVDAYAKEKGIECPSEAGAGLSARSSMGQSCRDA